MGYNLRQQQETGAQPPPRDWADNIVITAFFDKLHDMPKRERFMLIIGVILVLGVIASLITRVTWIKQDDDDLYRIAVVAPVTGDKSELGRSIREGVQLFVESTNEAGGIGETAVTIDVYDDMDDVEKAREVAEKIVADKRVLAVIGHWSSEAAAAAGALYKEHGIPLIVPSTTHPDVAKDNEWLFSGLYNDREQARFMANYARNVLGHKLISVIVDKRSLGQSMAESFSKTLLRFGTKVRYTWEFDSKVSVVPQLQEIVKDLKAKKDAGTVFLAVNGLDGARLIKLMRDASVRNPVIAPSSLGTRAFTDLIDKLPGRFDQTGKYTDKMMIAAPLLFDTANETAQNFKNAYAAKFGHPPDWVAAYAYDAAQLYVNAIRMTKEEAEEDKRISASRQLIRDHLAGLATPEDAVAGITGATFFNDSGEAKKPVLVGIYNGVDIISALTQLQPIKAEGARNYIEELKQGRVLYVNDRFMYKTNVVYTGLQVNEIAELDREKNEYLLDFVIWFRYSGKFEPQDLEFVNAVETIKLGKPEDEKQFGGMTYRLYRVKGKFRFNYSESKRPYGNHLVGVGFTHRLLNKNNLQYVVDVLGIGLNKGATVRGMLDEVQALNPATGWVIDRAWISQDIVAKGTMGNPAYVGYASTDPDFSQIDLGVIIKKGEINVRDFIPAEFFIYIGIFALIGTVFAIGMDRRERGRFWAAQSWFLRVISWPLLLLSAGNITLDVAFQNLPDHYIDIIILVYDSLWWLVPARIIGIGVERFIWIPMEDHTERNIPNVIRVFASVIIYAFAGCGIVAFVADQALTSILASTGLLAMIIGLAIQANISNIFSGIVINMERPFNVGDWVQIGDLDEGRVVDITWRTVRVKVRNGYVISLPNGAVSESQIHNFNSFDSIRLELPLLLDAKYAIEESAQIMEDGLNRVPNILETPEREVRFKGVERLPGAYVSIFEIQFWIENYGRREEVAEAALSACWGALIERGIYPSGGEEPVHARNASAAPEAVEAMEGGAEEAGGGEEEEGVELEFGD